MPKRINKDIARERLFKDNEKFHLEQAKLPFEEKIRILVKLQKIAAHVKGKNKKMIWFEEK